MKALCVKQPWAEWIVSGRKKIETRKWHTYYRGPILIVASQAGDRTFYGRDAKPIYTTREQLWFASLPRGMAVGIVDLVSIVKMGFNHANEAMCEWYPGALSWMLANAQRIKPFPVRGQLSLFDVECPAALKKILHERSNA